MTEHMVAYVVQQGDKYEGGSAKAVSLSPELARAEALKLVAEAQEWDDEVWEDAPEGRPSRWQEEKPNYWTNGGDYIMVKPFELLRQQ